MALDYLKLPYALIFVHDSETATVSAKIAEFPGCVAQGDSIEDAFWNLMDAADGWICSMQDMGREIPPPALDDEGLSKVFQMDWSSHENK